MKTKLFLMCMALLPSYLFSQHFELKESSDRKISFSHTLEPFREAKVTINNSEYQDFGSVSKVVLAHMGEPALPYYAKAVLLPNTGAASMTVEHDGYYEIHDILVAPSKGSLTRNIDPKDVPYRFGDVYSQDAFYPGELAIMNEPFVLRKTRGAGISLFPYQYNPVTKTLRVYQNLRVTVTVDDSQTGINEISPKGLPLHEDAFASIYAKTFLNPPPLQQANYNVVPENGELLIIVPSEYAQSIAPLVDWKIKKGIKTTVIQVNPNPTVSDTEIKTIVQDFYATNPDLANVLLVGDSDKLASHTYGFMSGEHRWSDSYYGQLEGGDNDLYPEVFVGRFSGDLEQIKTMVTRTLEYETNPIDGDWMTRAAGIASNEGAGFGDDGESDFQHLRNIRYQLLNYDFSYVYEFYQGNQGELDAFGEPTDAMINQAINEGIGLLNYTGHGWLEGMVTGNYTNWSVGALNNNGKYPFVVSVACNNGTFVGSTCLAEAFLGAGSPNIPKGAIAMAASSILMAWAEPMETQDEMTNILTKVYSNNEKETLGGLFYNAQIGMLTSYNNSYTAREVMQTWVLFGDPSVTYRYRESQNIIANHPATGDENMTSFTIECDTDGVLFVISQDGVILGTAISSGGIATITGIVLTSDSDLTIVGTKQNYIPYEGTVSLSGLSNEELNWNNIQVYPNPAQDYLHIDWAGQNMTSIELIDIFGKVVMTVNPTHQSSHTIDTSGVADGFYLLKLANENSQDIRKIVIK